jgi:hypothetical protein
MPKVMPDCGGGLYLCGRGAQALNSINLTSLCLAAPFAARLLSGRRFVTAPATVRFLFATGFALGYGFLAFFSSLARPAQPCLVNTCADARLTPTRM